MTRPSPPPAHRRLRLASLLALGLAGCQSARQAGDDLDGPMFGGSRPTTYVIAPTSDTVHVRDLATVARILRRYKTLDAAERALVQSSVSRRLQGLIAIEVQRVAQEPRYRARREAIRRIPDRAVAAARNAELDTDIRAEAARRLAARLGGMVATAVTGPDNRAAVAFSRIDGERVVVENSAFEIDRPIASLTDGTGVQRDAGTAATFLSGPPVAVAAPR